MLQNINFYKQQQMQGELADPRNFTILLYEKIINNIKDINNAIKNKNLNLKFEKINNTLDIIQMGLIDCLKKEPNEETYDILLNFYNISIQEIISANINNNIDLFNKIMHNFSSVKESWENIKGE